MTSDHVSDVFGGPFQREPHKKKMSQPVRKCKCQEYKIIIIHCEVLTDSIAIQHLIFIISHVFWWHLFCKFTENNYSTINLVLPGQLPKFRPDLLLERIELHLIQNCIWCVYNIKYIPD